MSFLNIIGLWLFILAILLLPKSVVADSFLYEGILTPRILYAISSGSKLLFLAIATGLGFQVRSSFAPENPARRGWTGLAWGLGAYAGGQAYLAYHQIVHDVTPYPSFADGMFLAGQLFLIVGMLCFLTTYSSHGLALDRAAKMAWAASGLAVLAVVAFILRPLALQSTGLVEKAFNVGYPTLDGFLVVLATGLFLQARRLRGGGVWRTWRLFIVGILFGAAGDFCFAYSRGFDFAILSPLFDYMFACSYAILALGVHSQSKLQA